MKVRVYHDETGNIISIMDISYRDNVSAASNFPPVSITPTKAFKTSDVELTEDLANMPLTELHTKYKLELGHDKSRFVPLGKTAK